MEVRSKLALALLLVLFPLRSATDTILSGPIMRTIAAAGGGGGAPEVESTGTNSYTTGGALFTNSVTVAGSNPFLLVKVGIGDADPTGNRPVAVVWGASSLTQAWGTNNGAGVLFVRSDGWYLNNPTPGTANLIVTLNSTTADQVHIIWQNVTNAHASPVSGIATASGESTTPSVTVVSAANSLVISGATSDAENSLNVGSGPTLIRRILNLAADTDSATIKRAGAASTVMNYTSDNAAWAAGGLSIAPP